MSQHIGLVLSELFPGNEGAPRRIAIKYHSRGRIGKPGIDVFLPGSAVEHVAPAIRRCARRAAHALLPSIVPLLERQRLCTSVAPVCMVQALDVLRELKGAAVRFYPDTFADKKADKASAGIGQLHIVEGTPVLQEVEQDSDITQSHIWIAMNAKARGDTATYISLAAQTEQWCIILANGATAKLTRHLLDLDSDDWIDRLVRQCALDGTPRSYRALQACRGTIAQDYFAECAELLHSKRRWMVLECGHSNKQVSCVDHVWCSVQMFVGFVFRSTFSKSIWLCTTRSLIGRIDLRGAQRIFAFWCLTRNRQEQNTIKKTFDTQTH